MNVALGVQAINALKGDFLLFSGHQIHRRIREIESAIRANDHVVRAVESLALVAIRQDFVFSVSSHFDDGTQHTRTVNQTMLAVEGVAVGIAECNYFFFFAIGMQTKNLVNGFVAHIEEPGFVPDRALRKSKARTHYPEFG